MTGGPEGPEGPEGQSDKGARAEPRVGPGTIPACGCNSPSDILFTNSRGGGKYPHAPTCMTWALARPYIYGYIPCEPADLGFLQ